MPGGAVYADRHFYIGHAGIREEETTAYLGALLVEPRRHIRSLSELNQAESQGLGTMLRRTSQLLEDELGAERVYLFVLGHHVDHLHIWLVPRYPGTPREYWGTRLDEWPQAPRGGTQQIADLCARLRALWEAPVRPAGSL